MDAIFSIVLCHGGFWLYVKEQIYSLGLAVHFNLAGSIAGLVGQFFQLRRRAVVESPSDTPGFSSTTGSSSHAWHGRPPAHLNRFAPSLAFTSARSQR
jgi:hypothetical protein